MLNDKQPHGRKLATKNPTGCPANEPSLGGRARGLSDAELRSGISAALDDFIGAVQNHPEMLAERSRGRRHKILSAIWDFAVRTKYILSEMDNIEAGRPVRYPQHIKNYEFSENPSWEKIEEHMRDILTRSLTLNMMVNGEAPYNFGDWGEDIKSKAKVLVDSLHFFQKRLGGREWYYELRSDRK